MERMFDFRIYVRFADVLVLFVALCFGSCVVDSDMFVPSNLYLSSVGGVAR